jgi:hypothetical protein
MKQYQEADVKVLELSTEDFVRCSTEMEDDSVETPVIPVFKG